MSSSDWARSIRDRVSFTALLSSISSFSLVWSWQTEERKGWKMRRQDFLDTMQNQKTNKKHTNTHLFVLLQAAGLFLQTLHHLLQFFLFLHLLLLQLFLASCCLRDGLFTVGWHTAHFLQLKDEPDRRVYKKKKQKQKKQVRCVRL